MTRMRGMQGVSDPSFQLIVETIPGLIAVITATGEVEPVNRQVLERGLSGRGGWPSPPADLMAGRAQCLDRCPSRRDTGFRSASDPIRAVGRATAIGSRSS